MNAGKSTCLFYLLIAMLRRGQPVVYARQFSTNLLLFTSEFSALVSPEYIRARTTPDEVPLVILYDAMAGPINTCLLDEDHLNLIVLATSPQKANFRSWVNSGNGGHVGHITVEHFTREQVKWLEYVKAFMSL